jgi:YfiH family protein
MPFLFADAEARVVAAAHAGWRGALAGVLEATIAAMKKLGAKPERIRAGLGPCLRQPNFEVGLDLVDAFAAKHPASERFFAPGASADKRQFDLAGFGRWRLEEAGVTGLDDVEICTLGARQGFFSYRASRGAGENDFGRNLSAIALLADGT